MAKLADIAVYLERDDNTNEPLERQRLFNRVACCATEIFISFMGRRIVDGRGRLNIHLRGSSEHHERHAMMPKHMGSYSQYILGGFDWDGFVAMDERGRGDVVVDAIEKALVDICRRYEVDPVPYQQAADMTRASGYTREMAVVSLSKSTRDRKCRFSVSRSLGIGKESWAVEVTDKVGGTNSIQIIVPDIMSLSARYEFRHAVVDGDLFSLLDFQRRAIFSLDRNGKVVLPFVLKRHAARTPSV